MMPHLFPAAVMTALALLVVNLMGGVKSCHGLGNPAAEYCLTLGYHYAGGEDGSGNEKGYCLFPDGTRAEAWEFFQGKAGQQYSFCARNGLRTKTSTRSHTPGFTTRRAVCVGAADGPEGKTGIEADLLDLLERRDKGFIRPAPRRVPSSTLFRDPGKYGIAKDAVVPASFDWRDRDQHSFIGPIRDQGACGDCYAFGAAAAAEAAYNIRHRRYDECTMDFSESYIAWCLGSYGPYVQHFSGCDGADYEYAELEALTRQGVPQEHYFPYIEEDPGSCEHRNDPLHVFAGWGRIAPNDTAGIKRAIMEYGVLDAAIFAPPDLIFYSGGIYGDEQVDCPEGAWTATNHAVALVGWGTDAVLGEYWILRNSWGAGWGENGYMRIAVNAARVGCSAAFLRYTPPPSIMPWLLLLRRE